MIKKGNSFSIRKSSDKDKISPVKAINLNESSKGNNFKNFKINTNSKPIKASFDKIRN